MELVGFRKGVKKYEGKEYSGYNLFFTDDPWEGGEGISTDRIWIGENKLDVPLELGAKYRVNYNRFGRIDALVPTK